MSIIKKQVILERRIKARAALLGLSVTDIARLGGVSAQSIFTWLKKGLTPKGEQVICDVLAVPRSWLHEADANNVGVGITAAWAFTMSASSNPFAGVDGIEQVTLIGSNEAITVPWGE